MPGRLSECPDITLEQAHSALKFPVATGRLTAREVRQAVEKHERLVAEIRARLEDLGGQGGRFLTSAAALRRPPTKRRRRKPSAKAVAAWRAQGRYLGAVRRLPKAARAKVRAIRESKGVAAAIVFARRLRK